MSFIIRDERVENPTEEEFEKYRNYGNPKIFYVCSEHSDCAIDHKDYQGKVYVDEKWEKYIQDKKLKEKIKQYISSHDIDTIQHIIGEPVYLGTRPHCRHVFKSVTADDILNQNYNKPASMHNKKSKNNKRKKGKDSMSDKELIEMLVANGSCETKREALKRVKNMTEEMKQDLIKSINKKSKEMFLNDSEYETLVVKSDNGKWDYVEWDLEEQSKEEMIEMLKEDNHIVEIYEGITNAGPMGLLWKKEEVDDTKIKDNESEYQKYKQMIANGKKLSSREGRDLANELRKAGKNATVICKIPNERYEKWFNEYKDELGTDIEDETTYITSVNEKAFNPDAGGYSIFGKSLGAIKRDDSYSLDRIERMPFEWMMIIENESEQIKDSKCKDDYGWSINSDNSWDAWEEWIETVGIEKAADDLARALSAQELADNLAYIFRENDFSESEYLEKE